MLHGELARLPREFDADADARVLVITGAGRAFCAGGDFSPTGVGSSDRAITLEEGRQIVDHLLECSKPVISAVNGYAMGLGATVALLADVVYAARSAVFADTHVVMGIGAGDGGQLIWPLLMGVNRAKYFLMTGERLPAEEAERLGLVNFVVDDGTVVDEALALAAPPGRRSGPGDLGVEDGDQRLHADGVEPRPAAVAEPGGPHDGVGRPPRGRAGVPGEAATVLHRALIGPMASAADITKHWPIDPDENPWVAGHAPSRRSRSRSSSRTRRGRRSSRRWRRGSATRSATRWSTSSTSVRRACRAGRQADHRHRPDRRRLA